MSTNAPEIYWAASNGDFIDELFFSRETAMASNYAYLESFDAEGKRVQRYELNFEGVYTTDS